MKKATYTALLLIIAVALAACSGKREDYLRRLQKRRNGSQLLAEQNQPVLERVEQLRVMRKPIKC